MRYGLWNALPFYQSYIVGTSSSCSSMGTRRKKGATENLVRSDFRFCIQRSSRGTILMIIPRMMNSINSINLQGHVFCSSCQVSIGFRTFLFIPCMCIWIKVACSSFSWKLLVSCTRTVRIHSTSARWRFHPLDFHFTYYLLLLVWVLWCMCKHFY